MKRLSSTNANQALFIAVYFSVTCVIMQTNTGAGLTVSSTCYWDKSTDCKSIFFISTCLYPQDAVQA